MQYITGFHALNCHSSLRAPDTLPVAVDWTYPEIADTETAFFKDFSIETNKEIPYLTGTHNVANPIRAVLDLVIQGKEKELTGLKHKILANDLLTEELFNKVIELQAQSLWNDVSWSIGCEYGTEWLEFLKSKNIDWPTNPNPNFQPITPTDNTLLAFVQVRIAEFKQFQKISTLAGLFHSVLFREPEINRTVKIELRAFLCKLHSEELCFLKEIDHYPSNQLFEEDYKNLCKLLKIESQKLLKFRLFNSLKQVI